MVFNRYGLGFSALGSGASNGLKNDALTFWALCEGFGECVLQGGVGAADLVDYTFCPVEVFLFSLQRPSFGRVLDYVSQVAGLVG